MAERAYTQREWRLLSWWLATYHPHADITMNARVGPTPALRAGLVLDAAEQAMARVRNRWLDAIVVEGGVVYLVEAKLEPDPGIFSQLIHYARKFRIDPSYKKYEITPIRLIALVYHDDPSVAQEAPWYGVQWVVYQPRLDQLPPAASRGLGDIEGNPQLESDWPARLASWGIEALSR